MFGGCSLGSIFANLCVAAPVSKNVCRATSCCQRWPLNQRGGLINAGGGGM